MDEHEVERACDDSGEGCLFVGEVLVRSQRMGGREWIEHWTCPDCGADHHDERHADDED